MKIGINGFLSEETAPYIQELGVSLYREGLSWSEVEIEPDKWDWSKGDRIADLCRQLNIKWFCILFWPFEWSWQYQQNKNMQKDMIYLSAEKGWWEFIKEVINRYSDVVYAYEIGHAPMCGSSGWHPNENLESYVEFFEKTSKFIKSYARKSVLVAHGSLDPQINIANFYELVRYGLLSDPVNNPMKTDAITFQSYWMNENNTPSIWNDFVKGILTVRSILQTCHKDYLPIWITETGWPVGDDLGLGETRGNLSSRNVVDGVQLYDHISVCHRLERILYFSRLMEVDIVIIHTIVDGIRDDVWGDRCGLLKRTENGFEKRWGFNAVKDFITKYGG